MTQHSYQLIADPDEKQKPGSNYLSWLLMISMCLGGLIAMLMMCGAFAGQSAGGAQARVPREILGKCEAYCVPEKGSGYGCPYTPTYPVWFRNDGQFSWRSPYLHGSTVEVGRGLVLSRLTETRQDNGSWEAKWYGGNVVYAPVYKTHCACYYAKGLGRGKSWYLSNYGVVVKNVSNLAIDAVCPQDYQCPDTNQSAFEKFGPPWIEAYKGCNAETLAI